MHSQIELRVLSLAYAFSKDLLSANSIMTIHILFENPARNNFTTFWKNTQGWLSSEHVWLMTWCLRVRYLVEANFLYVVFSPLAAEAYEKSSWWLWKESCVSTGVRKPGNTCYVDFAREHDICSRRINQSDHEKFLCSIKLLNCFTDRLVMILCHVWQKNKAS